MSSQKIVEHLVLVVLACVALLIVVITLASLFLAFGSFK